MAQPTTIKGGKVVVTLGKLVGADFDYAAPCGFTSKSVTFDKALGETLLPDCEDPDAVGWLARDAESLSMGVSGEGVLAEQSTDTWLDAWHSDESVPVKVAIIFPSKTITYTGKMHVSSFSFAAPQSGRVTSSVEMQSDGEMKRTVE